MLIPGEQKHSQIEITNRTTESKQQEPKLFVMNWCEKLLITIRKRFYHDWKQLVEFT